MADLDDFFAKKDKKKSKTVKKFPTTDDLAKKLEETTKKGEVKVKKERLPPSVTTGQENEETGMQIREEDEWKDFEEEKKDYSGLKIGHLTVSEVEQAQGSLEADGANDSDGDGEGEDSKHTGPWKKVTDGAITQPKPEQEKPKASAPRQATTTGVYVPIHLRNAGPQLQQKQVGNRPKNRNAPDIHNEEFFPTLVGGKTDATKPWGRRKPEGSFEEVKHGGRVMRSSEQAGTTPLSLGNRFNTLADAS